MILLRCKTDDREEENSSGSENEETKELNTLYEIITEQGYEIEKLNIERLFRLGFDRYELVVDGFIRKYLENQERDDKDVQKSLMQYLAKKVLPPVTLTGLQEEVQVNTNAIGNLNANRGAIVEIPAFYGTSGEDPEEWASKFEKAFTVNGLGNDDTQRFIIAKARLMGEQQIG
ncbi:hypothetical protein GLOIN_2v1784231 [Rhizophagus irregularis DAOM 181602=DAOM 197198]|nr:hypothetical protein GLOIN_2v1784231 [Rhizophagus irregularis DAOM 181602=DAOM 197198]